MKRDIKAMPTAYLIVEPVPLACQRGDRYRRLIKRTYGRNCYARTLITDWWRLPLVLFSLPYRWHQNYFGDIFCKDLKGSGEELVFRITSWRRAGSSDVLQWRRDGR